MKFFYFLKKFFNKSEKGKPAAYEKKYSVKNIRLKYASAYRKWGDGEDKLLLKMRSESKSINELAVFFGRKRGAINSRLRKLNLPLSTPNNIPHPNDPLYGKTLESVLEYLVKEHGWEELGREIPINCFTTDPSIKSSLKFLRKTPWARGKVESLYIETVKRKELRGE